ncbi:hypothetical protein CKM354_001295300 [Cercospora kikuchii]|uniref:BTB domain-containing protein n=1 Tax=Cercospora kikuchii TaxID=84275 RepID=A0A9P3FN09_9PEZI|nr:uncharacterized protein CKM354_001295300 [Cercospora kikuchii]GIZ49937.1 hypothetical protein CKM354_001295300 [Cercospora kikuchii]
MAIDLRGNVNNKKQFQGGFRTVEVGAGDESQRWTIHEKLLCKDSAFFRAATKEEWTPREDGIIAMPDDDPHAFEIYVQWLYGGKLLVQARDMDPKKSRELRLLVESFILGEKLQDRVFQHATIDSLIACVNDYDQEGTVYFPAGHADRVYEATPENSPLRSLIVDMFVYHGHSAWVGSNANTCFLRDVARKVLDIRGRPAASSPIALRTATTYHHKEEPAEESSGS